MLLEPRRAIETALLYLTNMPVDRPDLRTIESAERLLTDSAIICQGLPDLINDPESKVLVLDLNQFLNSLQEPLGRSMEEMARTLSQVQDEMVWLLLKLDFMQSSAPAQNPSSAKIERNKQWMSPLARLPIPSASGSLSQVVKSMRQLTLITNDDLYSAVSFLTRLSQLDAKMGYFSGLISRQGA
jgi:hypothetical protein